MLGIYHRPKNDNIVRTVDFGSGLRICAGNTGANLDHAASPANAQWPVRSDAASRQPAALQPGQECARPGKLLEKF
jgi:hypothetical protein